MLVKNVTKARRLAEKNDDFIGENGGQLGDPDEWCAHTVVYEFLEETKAAKAGGGDKHADAELPARYVQQLHTIVCFFDIPALDDTQIVTLMHH